MEMMRWGRILLCRRLMAAMAGACLLLALGGCIPERVAWSPDGTRAAVVAADALRLCDAKGVLGPPLMQAVQRVAWLAGSKRLLIARNASFSTWTEVVRAIPGAELNHATLEKVRSALLANAGDWEKFGKATEDLPEDERVRALIYLREKEGDLRDRMGDNYQHMVDVEYSPPMCELYEVEGDRLTHGAVLFYGKQGRQLELRPSPDGQLALLTVTSYSDKAPDKEDPQMYVVRTGGSAGPPAALALGAGCTYPDWTEDGKSVIYCRRAGGGGENPTGTISIAKVVDGAGNLLAKAEGREDIAPILYGAQSRVRRLGNTGGVAVNAPDWAPNGTQSSLFVLDSLKKGSIPADLLAGVTVPKDSLQYFAISPDGKHVAIPAEHGEMFILDLATKQVVAAQPAPFKAENDKLDSIPTWRNPDELCFARPTGDLTRREQVLYSLKTGNCVVLSADWPAAATDGWLTGLTPPPAPGLP